MGEEEPASGTERERMAAVGKRIERRGTARHWMGRRKGAGAGWTKCVGLLTVRHLVQSAWHATWAKMAKNAFKLLSCSIYARNFVRVINGEVVFLIMPNS